MQVLIVQLAQCSFVLILHSAIGCEYFAANGWDHENPGQRYWSV